MYRAILVYVFCVFVCIAPEIYAQQLQQTEITELDISSFPEITFKAQFPGRNEVKRYISAGNTEIIENGMRQQFTVSCPIDQISFALILDKSLSMAFFPNTQNVDPDSNRWRNAKAAIKTFSSGLVAPDSACLISFARDATLEQEFTSDGDAIGLAVEPIRLASYTGTWRACELGIDQLKNRTGSRAIILLNDGDENVSWIFGGPTFNAIIDLATQHNVAIYTIGLGEFNGGFILQNLSDRTGGKYYFSGDGSDLTSIYMDILASIALSPCEFKYMTDTFCEDGTTRTIDLQASVLGDSFQADTSYVAPFNLETTTVTARFPDIVFPGEEFKLEILFETELRQDQPTAFTSQIVFDPTAVEFVGILPDSGIFIENDPVAVIADGVLSIDAKTTVYTPRNNYLFTLVFRAIPLRDSRPVDFQWAEINVVRKCNTLSAGEAFAILVDGLCGKIVRRVEPPLLQSSYPNPSAQFVGIAFQVSGEHSNGRDVTITVQNEDGSLLSTLADGFYTPGDYNITWDPGNVPNGVYWIELRSGSKVERKKQIILR